MINMRRPPREVLASIAHELSHAMEVLAERQIQDDLAIFNFYNRQALKRGDSLEFETIEAIETEIRVQTELGRDFNKNATDLTAKR
jgi:hypothetical protein